MAKILEEQNSVSLMSLQRNCYHFPPIRPFSKCHFEKKKQKYFLWLVRTFQGNTVTSDCLNPTLKDAKQDNITVIKISFYFLKSFYLFQKIFNDYKT